MLVLLPLVSFGLLVEAFRRRQLDWRRSLLYAAIPWALFTAFITEGLSAVHWLTRAGLAVSWLIFALASVGWLASAKRAPRGMTGPQGDLCDPSLSRFDLTDRL